MSDQRDLREAPVSSAGDDGERLNESVFTDAMAAVSGVGGLAGGIASLYYARAQYLLARDDRGRESDELRTELEARYEVEGRAPYAELDLLDGSGGYHEGFGVDEDYDPGFGVDDDYYGGFGV